jgi:Protein of unknown function (DUF2848)
MDCGRDLKFTAIARGGGVQDLGVNVSRLVIAGWTGRDRAAVVAHVEELRALGVQPPATIPSYYEVDSSLLTHEPRIAVIGSDTSGEAEVVVISYNGECWVTIGSDHTDRALETISIAKAKQICRKPLAAYIWRFDEVSPHWDRLVIRCYVTSAGVRDLYQEGTLAHNVVPESLLSGLGSRFESASAVALFCGTQPVRGAIRGGERFELELLDPVLGRSIRHSYAVEVLPEVLQPAKL